MRGFPRTYKAAVRRQLELREQIVVRGGPRRVRRVAGADISYDRGSDHFFAAVVVLSYPDLEPLEQVFAEGKSPMPYIPGLLSFREGPLLLRAFSRLKTPPDLILFDAHGLAHPRRFGVACHLGLLLNIPSIGCGKTRLCGEYDEPGPAVGDSTSLRLDGKRIGSVLRTRVGTKPIFVSPGHLIGFPQAERWVLGCGGGYRLPEPTRIAHKLANQARIEGKRLDA